MKIQTLPFKEIYLKMYVYHGWLVVSSLNLNVSHCHMCYTGCSCPGIILYMHLANERWRHIVTSSLIGWAHTQNDACLSGHCHIITESCPDANFVITLLTPQVVVMTLGWCQREVVSSDASRNLLSGVPCKIATNTDLWPGAPCKTYLSKSWLYKL